MSSQFEWDKGVYNRNKHVLDELLKRNDVEEILSIDFFPFNIRSYLRLYLKSKVYKKIGKNVIAMGHHYVARRLNNKLISLSATSLRRAKKAIFKLNFQDAIIINYNPLNAKYLRLFRNNKKYFDTVDNWINNSIFSKYRKKLEKNYKDIVLNSNFVFTVSEKLKDDLEKIAYCKQITETAMACVNVKNNIKFISNGVDLEHYKNPINSERINDYIVNIKKDYNKIIGYVGVIKNDRVDINLLDFIVDNNKELFFLIAGPIHGNFDIQRFKKYKNISFIGEIKYKEMPFIYNNFDVCIIPHLVNDFINSMDPKKLYEYLASGKPVVTTNVSGVEKFRNYIKIANSKEEFSSFIKDIVQDENYFSEKNKSDRINSVIDYGWEKKVDEMINIINSN